MSRHPAYFVFDIESVADPELVAKVHYNGDVPATEAVARYRAELMEKTGSDFIPYTFQVPVSLVFAMVSEDLSLDKIVVLGEPEFGRHEICKHFWGGWTKYGRPTLVSFNGRGFDLPLLELAAFRYGVSLASWFGLGGKTALKPFEQPRHRFNTKSHLDLCDVLTNFGATRFNGGLNLAASLLGKPGKIDTKGDMVQDLYDAGEIDRINDYCRCDVLDTYFVFLRIKLLTGCLTRHEEQVLVKKAKDWIEQQAENCPAYRIYLDNWGDWPNPWEE